MEIRTERQPTIHAGMFPTRLRLAPYRDQCARWPSTGRHVLAQYDDWVYQAYRRALGDFAASHGWFGGGFSLDRMSWIKPGFLWMMYRSGWGTRPGQEVVLAVSLHRAAFDEILARAVPSSHVAARYPDHRAWKDAIAASEVRLQWDPDHDPNGVPLERRAVQLGLRGSVLARYAREWIVAIEDISGLVAAERARLRAAGPDAIETPRDRVYPLTDAAIAALGADPLPASVNADGSGEPIE